MRLLGNSTFDKLLSVNGTGNSNSKPWRRLKSYSNPSLSPFSQRGKLQRWEVGCHSKAFQFSERFWAEWCGDHAAKFCRTLALVLIGLSLAGCGSFSPKPDPSRFFTLTAIAQPGAATKGPTNPGISIGIGPIRLPGYLDRQELVTRVSQNRIDLSEYDRWAEPLDTNFTRVLGQNLSVLLNTDRVVFYPWELNRRPNYQLTIEVVRFESNARGEAQLSARWEILDTNKRMPLQAGESGITRQPTAQSTDASVAALSEALGEMSGEIANAVSAIDGQRK